LARCPSFDFAMLCIAPGPCIQLDQPKLVKEHIEEEVQHDPSFMSRFKLNGDIVWPWRIPR